VKSLNIGLSPTGKFIGICLTGLLFLAACTGSESPDFNQALEVLDVQAEEPSPPSSLETDQVTAVPTNGETTSEEGYPVPMDQPIGDPGPGEGYPAPGDQLRGYPVPGEGYPPPDSQVGGYPVPGEGQPPPVKTALEATNPSTVSLASGEIQLVEFFAFW